MRPRASPFAAAALIAGAACCFGGGGACVVGLRCEPMYEPAAEVCPWSPPELDPVPASCPGVFHEAEDCAGLGYTVRCEGGYSVAPGVPCG